jgi:thiosulfate dehydrogenase
MDGCATDCRTDSIHFHEKVMKSRELTNRQLDIEFFRRIVQLLTTVAFLTLLVFGILLITVIDPSWLYFENHKEPMQATDSAGPELWRAPAMDEMPAGPEGNLIRYGRELIANTAAYLGPNGTVSPISNGMNCQNCHLEAGTKPFGNNYSAVASTYPKFRPRSGTVESIEKRVNDCFERSLNGKSLDSSSLEMRAIVAYIKWLGKDVPKGITPLGAGLVEVPFLNRAADPEKGKQIYELKCALCHGKGGEGVRSPNATAWTYPPLWGPDSYNTGAGLYRLSRFAGYIKANMPLGASFDNPQLTDEEVWDLAAYVNSQPRPVKDITADWPDISTKPVDHPFGPFHDGFSEADHKYGPFGPIVEKRKKLQEARIQ